MTISPPEREPLAAQQTTASWPFAVENSITFTIGPDVSAAEALERADTLAALALPRVLQGAPDAARTCADVRAVLTELVDVTARHKAGDSLVASITYDGAHVTVSVGDMDRPLPAPEEEPGLYLVHGVASDVGQYAGDHGGRVTWAAVSART